MSHVLVKLQHEELRVYENIHSLTLGQDLVSHCNFLHASDPRL